MKEKEIMNLILLDYMIKSFQLNYVYCIIVHDENQNDLAFI